MKIKTSIPPAIAKALDGTEFATIYPQTAKKLIPTWKQVLLDMQNPFKLRVQRDSAIFTLMGETSNIHFSEEDTKAQKVQQIRECMEWMCKKKINSDSEPEGEASGQTFAEFLVDSAQPEAKAVVDDTPADPINQEAPSDPHAAILAETAGESSGDVLALVNAKDFYQQVKGSDTNSRYVFVGANTQGDGKLAVRLRGAKVSIRFEPKTLPDETYKLLGLTASASSYHASTHFQCGEELGVERYMALVKAALPGWTFAPLDFEKIRELGV